MGRDSRIRKKRRELRQYVNQAQVTPAEANEAMRKYKKAKESK